MCDAVFCCLRLLSSVHVAWWDGDSQRLSACAASPLFTCYAYCKVALKRYTALKMHCPRVLCCILLRLACCRWDGDFQLVQQLLACGALGRLVEYESHFDRCGAQQHAVYQLCCGSAAPCRFNSRDITGMCMFSLQERCV